MAMAFPHSFADASLRRQALDPADPGFERLEWLGDRVLGCAVAQALYRRHPKRHEADLSRAFGQLINNKRLTRIAQTLDLGVAASREQPGTLADIVEALLGAVMLDAGMEAVCACVDALYQGELANPASALWEKDAKSRLKEICEARQRQLPRYVHSQLDNLEFSSQCEALGLSAAGTGATKNQADLAAAARVLAELAETSR